MSRVPNVHLVASSRSLRRGHAPPRTIPRTLRSPHPTPPRGDVADVPRDGRDVVGLVEVPTGGPGEVLCEPRRVATPRRRRARDVLLLFVFPFPLLVIRTMDLNELFSF